MGKRMFGVDADLTTGTFTRLADAVGKSAGRDFDDAKPFGGRKRCNLTNDGVVLAYRGEPAYSENGYLAADVVKDGRLYPAKTPVQVMVEQPKFYYKVEPILLEDIEGGIGQHLRHGRWFVSEEPAEGFRLHPNFLRNGRELDFTYSSAFEGCLFDASSDAYCLEDEQIFGETVEEGDMLSSIAGAKPACGIKQFLTRANARVLTAQRGAGWQVIDHLALVATSILFLVEYASFDGQKNIGMGVVGKEPGSVNASDKTGQTSFLGDASGSAPGEVSFSSVTYRGEENLWGNIWTLVDGLNFQCSGINEIWWSDHDFKDDCMEAPYRNAGFTLCKEHGYTTAFGYTPECDFMFLTTEGKGTEQGPVGDYFMQKHEHEGFTISMLGGRWSQGPKPGLFFWYADCMTGNHSQNVSVRALYLPQK